MLYLWFSVQPDEVVTNGDGGGSESGGETTEKPVEKPVEKKLPRKFDVILITGKKENCEAANNALLVSTNTLTCLGK